MSDEFIHDDDDSRLKAVLRAVEADAPLPDAAMLDAIRQRAAEAFLSNEDRTGLSAHPKTTTSIQSESLPARPVANLKRRHPMVTQAIRGLCVASAAAAMLMAWLVPVGPEPVLNAAPFSLVIDELRGASSLQFQLLRDGQQSEVWVRAPGLVRKEETPQKYAIAAGSRLWHVDEEANTVVEGDSPWFSGPDQHVDLVALLDVGVRDATALLKSKPHERTRFEGRDCFVYRAQVEAASKRIELEAFVDAQTQQLAAVFAFNVVAKEEAELMPRRPLAEMRLIAMNDAVADEKFVVAKSLTEDGRIGKVSDSQGVAVIRPMLAKRWTPLQRDLVLKPGDWLRTELRGANAVKVTLSSEVELTVGPGSLIECISPMQARLHMGEVQVSSPHAPREESRASNDADSKKITGDKADANPALGNRHAERDGYVLLAPREGSRKFAPGTKQLVRVDRDEQLVDVPQVPVWLAGFEGTSNNESLGSLIVKLPDGRNEPLTVGYHKVSVEIRDQIARTTIEESFVNHTRSRLEGTFHFPLPQDASIGGFGMWIGNDLVDADIVEKQRAREIYETILRERRDPGLLEWTAGNLFKARVFPIEPHSEKRVKIVYTQVLPLRGNRYRYSYGLRSDLLRAKPLRELNLTVTVNSALPLKSVKCSTHPARTQQTAHSAQVEFAAQEYLPNKDFEVVCEVDSKQSDVVVIPHRRGDDGYLLVQLTPPGTEGNWQRELIPEGKPLNVVLLCDTSASMDSEKRKQQAEFVATVLSSLGADDRFQLAACDVGVEWFTSPLASALRGEGLGVRGLSGKQTPDDKAKAAEKTPHPNPLPAEPGRGDKAEEIGIAPTAENVAAAKDFLAKRVSLGWTNLDRAFAEVIKKSAADAQVIYIGDGIVSAGDTDPARFVARLGRLLGADTKTNAQPTADQPSAVSRSFHSVTVGNISEAVVLKGIASMGGGSVRAIGSEQTGVTVAKELLNEIAQPGLRDLKVEFKGVKVAAVYPERLPNVAAGMQQILVGRYLPEGKDQAGEIIVTGRRGTEAVRYVAKINFKEAEDGNSFIPRLWARGHLDHLLAQGQSAAVKDDIIGLSEQFHIITPYTSLLVLETDADRERFGVKRRYEMRDGERFFAQGRDNASFELVQQQMRQSRSWRLNMRAKVLRSLAQLGRDPQAFQQSVRVYDELRRAGDMSGTMYFDGPSSGAHPMPGPAGAGGSGFGGGMGGGESFEFDGLANAELMLDESNVLALSDGRSSFDETKRMTVNRSRGQLGRDVRLWDSDEDLSVSFGVDKQLKKEMNQESLGDYPDAVAERAFGEFDFKETQLGQAMDYEDAFGLEASGRPMPVSLAPGAFQPFGGRGAVRYRGANAERKSVSLAGGLAFKAKANKQAYLSSNIGRYDHQGYQQDTTRWLRDLFPTLPDRPRKPPKMLPDPEGWSPELLALSRSLLRAEGLSKLEGGIELKRVVVSTDPRWKRQSARNSDLVLYSPQSWLTRTLDLDQQTVINYATADERGAFSLAYLLGQVRKSHASELTPSVLALHDHSLSALHEAYRGYQAKLEPAGDDRVTVTFMTKGPTDSQRLLIDTARHVILKNESHQNGKVISTTTLDDFVEVAGRWLARKITVTDTQGRTTSETTLDMKVLTADEFAKRIATETAAKSRVQFLRGPAPTLANARQNVADGKASFDDRIMLLMHFASRQLWEDVLKQIDAAETLVQMLAAGKPGVPWIRTAALVAMRRNEEARQRYLAKARQQAADKAQDEVFLARAIIQQAAQIGTGSEMLELVKLLKPVFERQPADLNVFWEWQEHYKSVLDSLGRTDEALALRKEMVAKQPWQIDWHQDVARRLTNRGEPDAAEKWLRDELARDVERTSWEVDALRGSICDQYRSRGLWDRLLKFTTEWVATNPESTSWGSAYSQHLAALVYNDKLEDAYKLAEQWLTEARVPGKLTPSQNGRFDAALNFAQGSGHNLSFQRPDERWYPILAETCLFFVTHEHHSDFAPRIFSNHYFQQHDSCDRVRGRALHLLRTNLAKLTPAQIRFLRGAAASGRLELVEPINDHKQLEAGEVPLEIWRTIATELRARWSDLGRRVGPAALRRAGPSEGNVAGAGGPAPEAGLSHPTQDRDDWHSLGTTLSDLYVSRFHDTEALPFLRERIATAPDELKPGYYDLLFTDLVSRPWTQALEDEAFQTLRLLSRSHLPEETIPDARLSVQLPALLRLVDAMLANRAAHDEKTLRDAGEVNKLTRIELAKRRAETSKATRTTFAETLEAEAAQEEAGKGPLAPWLRMEQMWLDAQLDRSLDKAEERCWALLGEVPPNGKQEGEQKDAKGTKVQGDDDVDDEDDPVANVKRVQEALAGLLRQRAFITVMNLASRKAATPASIDRVLKYIDAGVAQSGPVGPRDEGDANGKPNADASAKLSGKALAAGSADAQPTDNPKRPAASALPLTEKPGDVGDEEERAAAMAKRAAWRSTKFQFLVALDRADDLERELRTWVREDQTMSPWRQSLARLLAERGKLDEAISIFESCEKDKLLSSSDFRMLSDWYLATNRRADHERAQLEAFKQMPEGNLGNALYHVRNRWYSGQNLPSELDENTLLTFKALFAKSANPENYLWQLREIYAACRDFRLLQMIPDAVLGRSPQHVYAFLQNLNSQVLYELRNEATADEILARVKSLREGERTPTDLRALDLLEALVERKSSEVLNQPGPHVEKCVAALRRGFDRDWQPGEPRLMSNFLYSLAGITNGEIAAEQLRELRALQTQAPAASRDHLFITNDLCNLLGWSYGKRDEAIAMMEIEVRDYAQANGGQWPHEDNSILGSFVSLYEGGGKHATGEAVVLKWLDTTKNDEQKKWLRDRLMALYNHALEHKGEVTLGKDAVLFGKIIDLGLMEIDTAPDEHVRYNIVTRMCATFDIAQRNKIGDYPGRLAKFVFESLPEILKRQQSQYRNTVQAPLHVTGQALSPKLALQYVVERIEQYPQRFEIQWDNGWQGFGYEMARRREVAAKEMGELAPRVLALAIKELKRDLRMGEARNQYVYYKHHAHFWAEKADDFAKAANEIYAERKTSGRRVRYIANYLRSGLERTARAIEILMIAYKDGILDASAQNELVVFLHHEGRHAESIPLLERLLNAWPDSMHYRTLLMTAYFRSQRPEQLATLVKQTDEFFHKEGRWVEANIAEFGKACLGTQLNEQAVGYLNEAISLHQRDHGGRTLNDAGLSDFDQHLAEAQSRLGRTKEAVEAASAAIICWGMTHSNRSYAMQKLNQVLSSANDLDDYVKGLDTEAAKTEQDSPILRKELGKVYQTKGDLPNAATQFELSLALQPLDREVHQALIACYDGTQQPDKATRQLMALIDSHRHDLELFKQLAARMKDNEQDAERAVTSIIESAPNEAESHAALGELRQQQNRWDEAIPHWEQVAELRRLEPTGLLKLAAAQIQLQQWEPARATINRLRKTEWPARFNNVTQDATQLEARLPK